MSLSDAARVGLPSEWASRIAGTDEAAMLEHADALYEAQQAAARSQALEQWRGNCRGRYNLPRDATLPGNTEAEIETAARTLAWQVAARGGPHPPPPMRADVRAGELPAAPAPDAAAPETLDHFRSRAMRHYHLHPGTVLHGATPAEVEQQARALAGERGGYVNLPTLAEAERGAPAGGPKAPTYRFDQGNEVPWRD